MYLKTDQPELLNDTVRHNLDLFEQHDDATLNSALRAAGLYSFRNTYDKTIITLDTPISDGGGNLSVGQRQMVALARAIVRQSKIFILDEGRYSCLRLFPTSVAIELVLQPLLP